MDKKRKRLLLVLVPVVLLLLLYVGVSLYDAIRPGYTTETAERDTYEDSVAIRGYVVRSETVLEDRQGLLELHFSEGEKVGRGQTVATLYSSEDAMALRSELEALEAQEERLLYAESLGDGSNGAILRLDSDITANLQALHRLLAADSLGTDSDRLIGETRSLILQRELCTEEDGTETAEALEGEIAALKERLSSASTDIKAPVSGIYSAVTDGYEDILTPETMTELSPSMIGSVEPGDGFSSLGKLIESSTWYFAAALPKEAAERLRKNESVTLRFITRETVELPCRVYAFGKSDETEQMVFFSSDEGLSSVSEDRLLSCELIFESYSGLRISKTALRVDENGQNGVYCQIGLVAYFKPVTVVYAAEEYILVAADDPNRETLRLREGDTVLLSSGELYDGMILG